LSMPRLSRQRQEKLQRLATLWDLRATTLDLGDAALHIQPGY
jgi:hypothetical protein